MNLLSTRQTVELFHLVFLRALYATMKDKALLAIKGGINLRFFFQSVRFSEDLDLDVFTMSKEALENRVDRLLVSPAVVTPLKARGIVIKDVTKPKPTQTAQKWKLGIANASSAIEERTKIEFSRRESVASARFEPLDAEIANAYALPVFAATHYTAADAIRQKIHALMNRSETQPRDVFDLNLLFARPDAPTTLDEEAAAWLEAAATNAGSLPYDAYASLVVAYLEPSHAAIFAGRDAWATMQSDVVGRIEALR